MKPNNAISDTIGNAFWVFQFQWPFLDRFVEQFRFLASKKWDSTITTHHISKRWWSLWSFQLSGWWNLNFFLPKHFRTKNIYLEKTNANVTNVAFSFPSSGPSVPYISQMGPSSEGAWWDGSWNQCHLLEARNPTRYRAPENEGFSRVYLMVSQGGIFLFFFGGDVCIYPEGE